MFLDTSQQQLLNQHQLKLFKHQIRLGKEAIQFLARRNRPSRHQNQRWSKYWDLEQQSLRTCENLWII